MLTSRNVLIDANVLIACYHQHDSLHARAKQALDGVMLSDLKLPYEVMLEVVTVLSMKLGSKEALPACDPLVQGTSPIEILPVKPEILDRAWEIYTTIPLHQFSLQDLILLAWAEALECRMVTFDEKLEALGRRLRVDNA